MIYFVVGPFVGEVNKDSFAAAGEDGMLILPLHNTGGRFYYYTYASAIRRASNYGCKRNCKLQTIKITLCSSNCRGTKDRSFQQKSQQSAGGRHHDVETPITFYLKYGTIPT